MKKFLITLTVLSMVCGSALAAPSQYDASFKKTFYEGFLAGMFQSLEQRLVATGYEQSKINSYIAILKTRVNRQQLERETWACVAKYDIKSLAQNQQKIADECFSGWVNQFFIQNKSLTNKLVQ